MWGMSGGCLLASLQALRPVLLGPVMPTQLVLCLPRHGGSHPSRTRQLQRGRASVGCNGSVCSVQPRVERFSSSEVGESRARVTQEDLPSL